MEIRKEERLTLTRRDWEVVERLVTLEMRKQERATRPTPTGQDAQAHKVYLLRRLAHKVRNQKEAVDATA